MQEDDARFREGGWKLLLALRAVASRTENLFFSLSFELAGGDVMKNEIRVVNLDGAGIWMLLLFVMDYILWRVERNKFK